jgi:carboxyl-terminal processing protease
MDMDNKVRCAFLFTISFLIVSCEKDDRIAFPSYADSVVYVNQKIEKYMRDMYLWYDQLPQQIDPLQFSTPQAFLDAMVYKPIDRWSFIITNDEYTRYFVSGKFIGFGFSYSLDEDDQFRISFVYSQSDLYTAGVRRGWIIEKIDGTAVDTTNISDLIGKKEVGITKTFLFKKPDGSEVPLSFTKKELVTNTVLYRDTIQVGNKVAGYIVFNGFVTSAKSEISKAFNYFNTNKVTELIFDLRYNGGGDVSIAKYVADILGGNVADKQPFATMTFNNKHTSLNTTQYFAKNSQSMNFNTIYFITSRSTASASEDLINGLKPFVPQKLIGTTTNGKPTGMISTLILGYYLVPITFKMTNKDGYGDFYSGLPVDKEVADDLTHDFGDRHEACLEQALYYIQNGTFKATKKGGRMPKQYDHHWNGFEMLIGAY